MQLPWAASLEELTDGQGFAFGTWPYYQESHSPAVHSYVYEIDWISAWDNQPLYIGIHGGIALGEWMEWYPEDPFEFISIQPCDDSWLEGPDGYLYYVDASGCLKEVLPGETVRLCLNICLDEDAGEEYRNKTFGLNIAFEAVQCSHGAASAQGWQFASRDN